MRIGLLFGRSFTNEPHMPDVVRLLTRWGSKATPLHLGDDLNDIARVHLDHDLYVLRSRTDLAMSVAGDLHRTGAALLNPYPVCVLLADRMATFRVLRAAGIRVPETFVASHVSQLLPALEQGPLIIRPHSRSGRRNVAQVVCDAAELAALGPLEDPVFAQRYYPADGPEQTIYAVAGELFGVYRSGPTRNPLEQERVAFTPCAELAELARRLGVAFGIDLFSVRLVESGGQTYVVDLSSVPSLRGVPHAARHLAEHIYCAAQHKLRGEPVQATTRATDDALAFPRRAPTSSRASVRPGGEPASPRVALYSQGMMGFGHIRRNASIAQALRASALQPAIVMIAEAWQAGALPLPPGVDCLTLPAIRREPDGAYNPRFLLDVSDRELIQLRADVIHSAMEVFEPDVLIVDYLPLGVANELAGTLERLGRGGRTRCVLGLREVLQDAETVRRTWCDRANLQAIRDFYDAVWIYGDRKVFDSVTEYGLPADVAAKVQFTGYLDQRPRLEFAGGATALLATLPPHPAKLVLCLVGGGHDGAVLAEAFLQATLPPDTTGVVVTGPLMPGARREDLLARGRRNPSFRVLEFVSDPTPLIARADRVVTMGGYNSMCEVLSFAKHALVVPRVRPECEQWIRAERWRAMGLVNVLHPDELTPAALTAWLARDLGPPPNTERIDLGGLDRIPRLVATLLEGAAEPVAVHA
ncbi:MAG TPA: hypothetical protein VM716_01985 [Gemmatimonadales bacterium]|nr:hypothetical protein [Gemmatimonadales bacterium]